MMDSILNTASYIVHKYKELTGDDIDEMKLHKLLYFTQRDSLAMQGVPAFSGDFEGWKFGPVSKTVRAALRNNTLFNHRAFISADTEYVANHVILRYGTLDSWDLSNLSHSESSWIKSRKGVPEGEIGDRIINLEDIKEDAKKVRLYDNVYDMYYDEFEDADENEREAVVS